MLASIVAKKVINHSTVPNRKRLDHHQDSVDSADAAVVVAVAELVAVVQNVLSVVMAIMVMLLVKQTTKRLNSMTMTSDPTNR